MLSKRANHNTCSDDSLADYKTVTRTADRRQESRLDRSICSARGEAALLRKRDVAKDCVEERRSATLATEQSRFTTALSADGATNLFPVRKFAVLGKPWPPRRLSKRIAYANGVRWWKLQALCEAHVGKSNDTGIAICSTVGSHRVQQWQPGTKAQWFWREEIAPMTVKRSTSANARAGRRRILSGRGEGGEEKGKRSRM